MSPLLYNTGTKEKMGKIGQAVEGLRQRFSGETHRKKDREKLEEKCRELKRRITAEASKAQAIPPQLFITVGLISVEDVRKRILQVEQYKEKEEMRYFFFLTGLLHQLLLIYQRLDRLKK